MIAGHLPLRRFALCLDCGARFEIGGSRCPVCASERWCPVARFLEQLPGRDGVPERDEARQLVIVSAARPRLYQRLRRAFAGNPTVEVIIDRRGGDRRRAPDARMPDRRVGDRRSRDDERDLRVLGWTVRRAR
jgi:hypothetical protein